MQKTARIARFVFVLTGSVVTFACSGARDGTDASSSALDLGALAQKSSPSLVIDETQTSVSGLSSGGFMAVQFHVAFSSIMRGAAIFAGGPYDCAQGSLSTAVTTCMSSSKEPDVAALVARTKEAAARGATDAIDHLAAQNVFLFGGADDQTVNPAVMDGLRDYYAALVTSGEVSYVRRRPGTAHTMPTVSYGGSCGTTASPYIGKCDYDGAGEALAAIYGALAPKATTLSGTFVDVSQKAALASPSAHSLAESGVAYVPASCAAGETCRVHIAFHGCKQTVADIGDAFYKRAGYNEWADTNRIVVLYPQIVATRGANPNGCWDWYGYDSADYANRRGPQMATVRAMLDTLAGLSVAPPDAGAGAGAAPAEAGALASACVTASNLEHVAAGRARVVFGIAYAVGSNDALGLAAGFVKSSLAAQPGGWRSVAICR